MWGAGARSGGCGCERAGVEVSRASRLLKEASKCKFVHVAMVSDSVKQFHAELIARDDDSSKDHSGHQPAERLHSPDLRRRNTKVDQQQRRQIAAAQQDRVIGHQRVRA